MQTEVESEPGLFLLLISVNWSRVHGEKGDVAHKAPAPESRKTFTVHLPALWGVGLMPCPAVTYTPLPRTPLPRTPVLCPSAVPRAPATACPAATCSPLCFSTPRPQVCHELQPRSTEHKAAFKPHAFPARQGHGAAHALPAVVPSGGWPLRAAAVALAGTCEICHQLLEGEHAVRELQHWCIPCGWQSILLCPVCHIAPAAPGGRCPEAPGCSGMLQPRFGAWGCIPTSCSHPPTAPSNGAHN